MIEIVTFKREHLKQMTEQPAMAHLHNFLTEVHYQIMEDSPFSRTILYDGRVIFCGGVAEEWMGRGTCWAIIDQDCKKEFVRVHKIARKFLHECPVNRIEAAVQIGFEAGHRWIKALGFQLEAAVLKAYLPGGADVSLYALVKGTVT